MTTYSKVKVFRRGTTPDDDYTEYYLALDFEFLGGGVFYVDGYELNASDGNWPKHPDGLERFELYFSPNTYKIVEIVDGF